MLHNLSLGTIFPGEPESVMQDTTARMLNRQVGTCDICGQQLPPQHRYVRLASTIADEERTPQVTSFFSLIDKHNWKALHEINEFDASKNAVVAFAIACPVGRAMVVGIRSPVELYESDELYAKQTAGAEEMAVIANLVSPQDWRPL
jgi:hypothetical protein